MTAFAQFQGKIYTSYHSIKNNDTGTIIYSIKGDKTLMDIQNTASSSQLLNQNGQIYLIGNKPAETYKAMGHQDWKPENSTIAGISCQYAALKSKYGQLEVWVAKQIPFEFSLYRNFFQAMGFDEKDLNAKITGFPLVMRITDTAGNIQYIQQTDEVKQLSIDDSTLSIPMAPTPEKKQE